MRYTGNIYNIYNLSYAQENYFRDLDLEGQGPKFNYFYSRQRRNLFEIFNNIAAKLWS